MAPRSADQVECRALGADRDGLLVDWGRRLGPGARRLGVGARFLRVARRAAVER
jgi:hypothetical protein